MNDRPTLDEIRARCALPVTEIVANPGEYYRVQTILRDRAELLRLHDALAARLAEAERERDRVREENGWMRHAIEKAVRVWGDTMTGDGADGETMYLLRRAIQGHTSSRSGSL